MLGMIEKVEYFSCGYCINKIHLIFKETPYKEEKFNAGVFLIKHRIKGYILYDTGYGDKILQNKLKYKLYNLLNPVTIKKEDMIDAQLKNIGISPQDIKYIILSHLHPDHIGGLEKFKNAKIVMSTDSFEEYKKNAFKSLIFTKFIPEDIENRLIKVEEINSLDPKFSENKISKYIKTYDLFSDGSIFLSKMNGHSKGQLTAYIPEKNLFIASDVSWKTEYVEKIDKMKIIPLLIQHDKMEYRKNIETLKTFLKLGINVVVSHDNPERIERILNEENL